MRLGEGMVNRNETQSDENKRLNALGSVLQGAIATKAPCN